MINLMLVTMLYCSFLKSEMKLKKGENLVKEFTPKVMTTLTSVAGWG